MQTPAINDAQPTSRLPGAPSAAADADGAYRLRPDIFVKSTSERVYLSHRDCHYILRLGSELMVSVGEFIDCIDGEQSLGATMSRFPSTHQPALLKFLHFLLQKGMAFRLDSGAFPAQLRQVRETLDYLSQYCSDPVERYRHFASRRTLLVGGGYALTSAIKTMARIGIRQLAVLPAPQLGHHHFDEQQLRACFEETKVLHDAELRFVAADALHAAQPAFDVILHCHERVDVSRAGQLAQTSPALELMGLIAGRYLFITDSTLDAADIAEGDRAGMFEPACAAPTAGLIAGATCALALFDQITGIRPAGIADYHYYDLQAQGSLQTARRCRLDPLEQEPGAPAADVGVAIDWPRLAEAPLFPLQPLQERTEARSYIKLYTVTTRAHAERAGLRVMLAAAGFTRHDCQQQLMLALTGIHQLGLSCCSPDEWAAFSHAACLIRRARAVVRDLSQPAVYEQRSPSLEARQEYIAFCISTTFEARLDWQDVATGQGEFPRCLIVRANDAAAFMPYSAGITDADRQRLLFGVYAQLWARQHGQGYETQSVFVPAAALPRGLQP
jgi:hypothetical protein